jgi:hypothetical protein
MVVKKRFCKKDLQKLVGKLNWCARVVVGGRTFMRNLINVMTTLKAPHHFTRLTSAAKADLAWWRTGLSIFHGIAPFTSDIALPSHQFATDACLIGGGAVFDGDWCYVNWEVDMPEFVGSNINVLELQTVHVAAQRWANKWHGRHIVVRSDNVSTVTSINKGTSRSVDMLGIVQKLFWMSVEFGFRLTSVHLPGRLNILSDKISRMHDVFCAEEAKQLLMFEPDLEVCGHMSYCSYLCLQGCWEAS